MKENVSPHGLGIGLFLNAELSFEVQRKYYFFKSQALLLGTRNSLGPSPLPCWAPMSVGQLQACQPPVWSAVCCPWLRVWLSALPPQL